MTRLFSTTALVTGLLTLAALAADDPKPADVKPAASKVTAVTVYQNTASYPDYLDIRDRNRSFEGLVAYRHETVGVLLQQEALLDELPSRAFDCPD